MLLAQELGKLMGSDGDFSSIDTKLIVALQKAARGALTWAITVREKEMAKPGHRLRGRHIRTLVYEHRAVGDELGQVFDV